MEIIYFHRKGGQGVVSIEENFKPIINLISKNNSVRVYTVPYSTSNPYYMLKNILFIRKHSSKDGINHITGDIHYGVLGLVGRKSVLTIHDDYAIRLARHGLLDKVYKWFFWFFLPLLLVKAPVCTTPSTLRNIKKLYNSKKLRVLTHQIAPSKIKDIGKPFNKDCPRFLQIGTGVNKNLETTLAAIKDIRCKLVVLKPMTDKQISIARELSIDYDNKWDLPFEDVANEYHMCDVVLFPSLFEGMGVPIIEGQAAGKAVITTNKDPMKWVAGGGAVLLDDPQNVDEYKEKLLKVIEDDIYRNSIIEIGKKNAERFNLQNSVERYMNLYKSLF